MAVLAVASMAALGAMGGLGGSFDDTIVGTGESPAVVVVAMGAPAMSSPSPGGGSPGVVSAWLGSLGTIDVANERSAAGGARPGEPMGADNPADPAIEEQKPVFRVVEEEWVVHAEDHVTRNAAQTHAEALREAGYDAFVDLRQGADGLYQVKIALGLQEVQLQIAQLKRDMIVGVNAAVECPESVCRTGSPDTGPPAQPTPRPPSGLEVTEAGRERAHHAETGALTEPMSGRSGSDTDVGAGQREGAERRRREAAEKLATEAAVARKRATDQATRAKDARERQEREQRQEAAARKRATDQATRAKDARERREREQRQEAAARKRATDQATKAKDARERREREQRREADAKKRAEATRTRARREARKRAESESRKRATDKATAARDLRQRRDRRQRQAAAAERKRAEARRRAPKKKSKKRKKRSARAGGGRAI